MSNPDERELNESTEGLEAEEQLTEESAAGEEGPEAELEELHLEAEVAERGACERHITVKISPEDVQRYFDREIRELMPTAQVPGFRPGRAPRKLVERRFRKEVSERIKTELIMDAIAQVSRDEKLTPISEPDLDIDAVLMPEEGPLTFEFDLEVRPEFPTPDWKGLRIEKPVREFTREDVDRLLEDLLHRTAPLTPQEGPAQVGDYLTCDITVQTDGQTIAVHKEQTFRLRRILSFQDARIEGIDDLLAGVRVRERRETEVLISEQAASARWRGQKVTVVFEVQEIKRPEPPELNEQFLAQYGFESEGELRDYLMARLQRQLEYQQRESARQQIAQLLTQAADWELPEKMLQRQSQRELERIVLELQRSGFSEEDIRAQANLLRQRSRELTAQRLREHFILERIAEEEGVEATEEDYQQEIALIAMETGETPRRVRARLEKAGLMDILRNQVIENKVIALILSQAQFEEKPYEPKREDAFGLDLTLTGAPEKESEEAESPSAGGAGPEAPAGQ